jgi:trans-aconitate methyltransferase
MNARFFHRAWRHLRWRCWDSPRGLGRPAPAAVFDREYTGGHWDHFHNPSEAPRYARLATLVSERGGPVRLLDLGCGSGRLAAVLEPKSVSSFLGIDISGEGIAQARRLAPAWAAFQVGDLDVWRTTKTWDVIVFNECIGYVRDPAATLARWRGALSPDGIILISYFRSGNHHAIWRRIARHTKLTHQEVVTGPEGHVWDIRGICARPTPASS